jgi:hypothetical protein
MYKDIDYNTMKDELRKFYGQYQESSKGKNVEQLWMSSFVNTDWYCRFRISALSLASACNIPASLSGAIPFVSFLSDLMYDQNLFCFW